MNEKELIEYLDRNGICYTRYDHDAVYTCAESNRLLPDLPGARTKNILLCDRRDGRLLFVMYLDHKRVDFKHLSRLVHSGKLSFATAEQLLEALGITPGAVNIFALANDKAGRVEVYLDRELWDYEDWHAHPMVNTSTLVINRTEIEKYLKSIQHDFQAIEIPT